MNRYENEARWIIGKYMSMLGRLCMPELIRVKDSFAFVNADSINERFEEIDRETLVKKRKAFHVIFFFKW